MIRADSEIGVVPPESHGKFPEHLGLYIHERPMAQPGITKPINSFCESFDLQKSVTARRHV